ncbi:RNA 3'-terminal phosphate cyclase-like protein [Glonium stellatum]|uniref:RNA 3'-terminal phosphate cyclase-like protein n=1 Tax=Glonium stellatum TaxID=574774 RepID=A0A8E2JRG7_9PEZI|nr:RNA 3'-terminal phosphate cyclase-like protein [Glonium stellatum]
MALAVHLRGTTLEGGGQLLRIAIGVSALTGIPIEITDIRGNRSGGGGLKMQHLSAVNWLGTVCKADMTGAEQKSKNLYFAPSTDRIGSFQGYREHTLSDGNTVADVQISQSTPGSIGLVLQAILPFLIFSGSSLSTPKENDVNTEPKPIHIKISGGTNVSHSPSSDYISQVLLPTLSRIGIPSIVLQLHSRGWTHGRTQIGALSFTITPLSPKTILPSFTLSERGNIQSLKATILAPKACEDHFRRELDTVLSKRHSAIFGSGEASIEMNFEDSRHDKRFYLLLVATSTNGHRLGRDWLYDRKLAHGKLDVTISKLVKQVVNEIVAEIENGGCVDEYMRDQLIVFQALTKGKSFVDGGRLKDGSSVPSSLHARTAEWVVNEILGVEFDGKGGCEGIGLTAGEIYSSRQSEKLVEEVENLKI